MSKFEKVIKKEWKELFDKNNVSDCIPYLKTAQNRIVYAIYDLNAYYYVKEEWKKRQIEMNEILKEKGKITDSFLSESRIMYCGTEMDYVDYLNKINFTFFNSLHSFFDVFGKFLFKTLLPASRASDNYLFDVINELKKHTNYANIIKKIEQYTKKDDFKYIYDLNNTNKHIQDIPIDSIFFINDGSLNAEIKEFKKHIAHPEENMINKLDDVLELVVEFYNDLIKEVIDYLNNIENPM